MSAVETFLENNPNFVPSDYPPDCFDDLLEREIDYRLASRGMTPTDNTRLESRPIYHYEGPEDIAEVRQGIRRTGVYNQVIGPDGEEHNVNILAQDEESRAVAERALEVLADGRHQVVLPFAKEAETVRDVILYAAGRVGTGNVVAVDAGFQKEATDAATATGERVVSQKDVLAHIDWALLKRLEVIPDWVIVPPQGHKGLTLYAGLLGLEALGRLEGYRTALEDTDTLKTGPPKGQFGSPGEYCPLDHLAVVEAFPVTGEPTDGYNMRTGDGRNNEPLTLIYNLIGYPFSESARKIAREDPQRFREIMKLSISLATIGWPSTGERDFLDELRRFPIIIGMDTETGFNVAQAGIGVRGRRRNIAQIANPNTKIENRESDRKREHAMVDSFSLTGLSLGEMVLRTGKHLDEWGFDEEAWYNHDFGAGRYGIFVPASRDHLNTVGVDVCTGLMLPSMEQIRELQAADFEGIRKLMGE